MLRGIQRFVAPAVFANKLEYRYVGY